MDHTFLRVTVPFHHFSTSTLLFYTYINLQINLEQAENLIKRHEAFLTTMEANDDKINNVVQFAGRLCDEGHFAGWWRNI
jgi:hypothetical protein